MAVFYADMKIFLMLVLLYWLLYGTIKRLRLKTCFVRKKSFFRTFGGIDMRSFF